MDTSKFGAVLRRERQTRGWSQAMLAQELGTTPNTISAWERNFSLPSPYFRAKLSTLLEKNAVELGLVQDDEQPVPLRSPEQPDEIETSSSISDLSPETLLSLQATEGSLYRDKNTSIARSQMKGALSRAQARKTAFSLPRLGLLVAISGFLSFLVLSCLTLSGFPVPWRTINAYGIQGTLVLANTLGEQNEQINWTEGFNENHASCQFKQGSYHSFQPLEGFFHACIAQATHFKNFTYEVEMALLQGDYGGLIFRAVDSIDAKYYLFRVNTTGSYALKRYVDKVDDDAALLAEGMAPSFHTGYGHKNRLAVVANNTHLTIYINGQELVSVTDAMYDTGQIGVFAGNTTHTPAEAAFSNIKVWSF